MKAKGAGRGRISLLACSSWLSSQTWASGRDKRVSVGTEYRKLGAEN